VVVIGLMGWPGGERGPEEVVVSGRAVVVMFRMMGLGGGSDEGTGWGLMGTGERSRTGPLRIGRGVGRGLFWAGGTATFRRPTRSASPWW
jgi:hypothetical protein